MLQTLTSSNIFIFQNLHGCCLRFKLWKMSPSITSAVTTLPSLFTKEKSNFVYQCENKNIFSIWDYCYDKGFIKWTVGTVRKGQQNNFLWGNSSKWKMSVFHIFANQVWFVWFVIDFLWMLTCTYTHILG